MKRKMSQVQLEKEIREINRRLDDIALQFTLLLNALQKKRISGLDKGLEEFRTGKYHTYKSVAEFDKAIKNKVEKDALLRKMNKRLKNSKLTAADTIKLGRKVNASLAKRYAVR